MRAADDDGKMETLRPSNGDVNDDDESSDDDDDDDKEVISDLVRRIRSGATPKEDARVPDERRTLEAQRPDDDEEIVDEEVISDLVRRIRQTSPDEEQDEGRPSDATDRRDAGSHKSKAPCDSGVEKQKCAGETVSPRPEQCAPAVAVPPAAYGHLDDARNGERRAEKPQRRAPAARRPEETERDGCERNEAARLPKHLVEVLRLQMDVLQRIDRRQQRLFTLIGQRPLPERQSAGQRPLPERQSAGHGQTGPSDGRWRPHTRSGAERRSYSRARPDHHDNNNGHRTPAEARRHSRPPPTDPRSIDSSSLEYYHRSGNHRTIRPATTCRRGPTTL